ncbi:MAG: glycosyltransferase family 4 protein, partial [Candidatus Omnitrophota bacterium]
KVVEDAKSVVIPLGFELGNFLNCEKKKGLFRKRLGIEEDLLLVGIVGRLVPIKNHRMFLDAARQIKDANPGIKVKFIVVGDGELRAKLEKYAEDLGLAGSIVFTGWVKDLAEIYTDLDVVVLSSFNEGTPVSLIEAMASGKPVVSTDVGGVRDVVEDGKSGFLVEAGDTAGFSSKIAMLLKNPGMRASSGAEGRKTVARKYTKERLVRDIEGLYTDLVSRKLKKART